MPKRKAEKALKKESPLFTHEERISAIFNDLFMFKMLNDHTRFFSRTTEQTVFDPLFRSPEIAGIKVSKVDIVLPFQREDTRLLKYLENFLKDEKKQDEGRMEIEGEKEKQEGMSQDEINELAMVGQKAIYDLFEKGYKAEKIAEFFHIKKEQVWYLHRKIERQENDPSKKPKPKRFLVTQEMLEELQDFLNRGENRLSTVNVMREHLIEEFNLFERGIAASTVSNMLKKLGFRRKKVKSLPDRRNVPSTVEKRKVVARKFISALIEDKEFIFIDETGFHKAMKPLYGYAQGGESCTVTSVPKGENHTLMAAITKSRVLGYQIFRKGQTAEDFGAFIVGLLQNNPEIIEKRSKYIIFIDNAPIHTAKLLKPLFERLNILFNAPYSPFLNPIEEFFGNCKRNFRKKHLLNTVGIVDKIHNSIQEIDPALLYLSFVHSLSYLSDCLQGKLIL